MELLYMITAKKKKKRRDPVLGTYLHLAHIGIFVIVYLMIASARPKHVTYL